VITRRAVYGSRVVDRRSASDLCRRRPRRTLSRVSHMFVFYRIDNVFRVRELREQIYTVGRKFRLRVYVPAKFQTFVTTFSHTCARPIRYDLTTEFIPSCVVTNDQSLSTCFADVSTRYYILRSFFTCRRVSSTKPNVYVLRTGFITIVE